MVHLAYPSGRLSQAMAVILASIASSILRMALSEFTLLFLRSECTEACSHSKSLTMLHVLFERNISFG